MQPETARLWLKIAAGIVIVVGLVIALGAWPATAGIVDFFTDLLFWPVDGGEAIATSEARLLAAVSGGVMVGWGVMIYLLADRLYPRDPALARSIMLTGLVCWFIVDSAGSFLSGSPLNVLGNLVFLALFLVPLRAARPHEAKA